MTIRKDRLTEPHTCDTGRQADSCVGRYLLGEKGCFVCGTGAFTPTCSNAFASYVVKADELKAKGVDNIICLSVNDAFVMDAWGKDKNAEQLMMVADGNGEFTRLLVLRWMGRVLVWALVHSGTR